MHRLGGEQVLGALLLIDRDTGVIGGLVVDLHELGDIELGLLDDLHLLDVHRLQGEDTGSGLLDRGLDLVDNEGLDL